MPAGPPITPTACFYLTSFYVSTQKASESFIWVGFFFSLVLILVSEFLTHMAILGFGAYTVHRSSLWKRPRGDEMRPVSLRCQSASHETESKC